MDHLETNDWSERLGKSNARLCRAFWFPKAHWVKKDQNEHQIWMYKILHRKTDPGTMKTPAECKHLHCFPLGPQNPGPLYLPLCHSKSSCPGQPLSSCLVPFPLSSESMKWKEYWIEVQKPEFWLELVVWPWASHVQSLRHPSLVCPIKLAGYTISSTFSQPDMPSSWALCHQLMKTSHLGPFLPFSFFSLFGSILRPSSVLHLSPSKASESPPAPASSTLIELPQ